MPSQVNLTNLPIPLQGVPAPGYAALDLRRATGAVAVEGVLGQTAYLVKQRTAGAAMAVDVTAGGAFVQGDAVTNQGRYYELMDTDATGANELTITAAHATLDRIDMIVLEVKDTTHDGSGLNLARLRVVTGTATSGATLANRLGAAALPSTALLLADVRVRPATTSILTGDIGDRRSDATVLVKPASSLPTNPMDGQVVTVSVGTNKYWRFQYFQSNSRWQFIGGPDLIVTETTSASVLSGAPATFGPTLTIPFAGDYQIWIGHRTWHTLNAAHSTTLSLQRQSDLAGIGISAQVKTNGVDEFQEAHRLCIDGHTALKNGTYKLQLTTTDTSAGWSADRQITARPLFCTGT